VPLGQSQVGASTLTRAGQQITVSYPAAVPYQYGVLYDAPELLVLPGGGSFLLLDRRTADSLSILSFFSASTTHTYVLSSVSRLVGPHVPRPVVSSSKNGSGLFFAYFEEDSINPLLWSGVYRSDNGSRLYVPPQQLNYPSHPLTTHAESMTPAAAVYISTVLAPNAFKLFASQPAATVAATTELPHNSDRRIVAVVNHYHERWR